MGIHSYDEWLLEYSNGWVIFTDTDSGDIEILYIAKSQRATKIMLNKLWKTGKYSNLSSKNIKDFELIYGNMDKYTMSLI